MMIEFQESIRRGYLFGHRDWTDAGCVKEYLKSLEEAGTEITNARYLIERSFGARNEVCEHKLREIESEKKLCLFFLGEQERKGENRDWTHTLKGRVHPRHDYEDEQEFWAKTNGKVRAIISLKLISVSTRVRLFFENDNEHLEFVSDDYHRGNTTAEKVLKSEKSIAETVEKYKVLADAKFADYAFPYYCHEKRELDILEKLLGVTHG